MKLMDLYTEYLANWLTGGNLVNRDKISSLGLKTVYDKFMTRKYITKTWCILKVPVNYNTNITEGIRSVMHNSFPNIKTIIHTYNVPVNVDVTSRSYTTQLGVASQQFDQYASVYSNLREEEKLTGKTEIDNRTGRKLYVNKKELLRIKENKDSYFYVYQATLSGKKFFETYFFIQASAKSRKELQHYSKELSDILNHDGIRFCELHGNLGNYLNNFCPAAFIQQGNRQVSPMLFSQENLAAMIPYRVKGLVGGSGLLLGLEWQAKLPFLVNFFESSAAQICMLLAKSGYGKTYVAFNIAQQAVGLDIHGSAVDIKGNEWVKLSKFIDLLVIDMGSNKSRFVNTLRLDNLECDNSNCLEMFNMALTGTITFFKLMINLETNEGNIRDLEMILEKAINKLYSKNEVRPDNPKTFIRSRNLKYESIIEIVSELQTSTSFNDNQIQLCNLIKTRCSMFFSSERFREAFKNEITVAEILNTPFIVYSFGKNRSDLDDLDTIKVFMAQFLDSQKQEFRKRKKKHTIAFYEELQRCGQFTTLVNYISSRVTGARSSNVSIFLLLNAISVFRAEEFAQIRSNITTKIIGKVEDEDLEILYENFGCKPIKEHLDLICHKEGNYYNNCFAIQYDTGLRQDKAIFKTVLPQYMWEEFNTRERISF